jgi:anaerobic ribonucleoside-triphosphate reductase activating protein
MSERRINVANFIEKSRVNGHGVRAVLWVQGCQHRCAGCFNPENQAFKENTLVSVSEMANRILMIDGIEGVTFSGGEPFNQAAALSDLAAILKEHGLTVMIFTGYAYAELIEKRRASWSNLMSNSDMLVTGRYVQEKATEGVSLVGSSNQKVISLTGKIPNPDSNSAPSFEIVVISGVAYLTGFPSERMIAQFKAFTGAK